MRCESALIYAARNRANPGPLPLQEKIQEIPENATAGSAYHHRGSQLDVDGAAAPAAPVIKVQEMHLPHTTLDGMQVAAFVQVQRPNPISELTEEVKMFRHCQQHFWPLFACAQL